MATALKNSIARLGSKLSEHKKDAAFLVVQIDACVRYSRQTRTVFAEGPLQELAESIKQNGILEPLLVRPVGNGQYEIIAGERRVRAARMAGLTAVPALCRDMSDDVAYKIHLAENIHRENLSTLELAQSVQRDVEAANGILEKVAEQYSKTKSWISKLCTIAQGGDSMNDLVDEGVTADRAVLAAVAALERKAPERAKELGRKLKAAPAKANKRAITEQFMKEQRAAAKKTERRQPAAGRKSAGAENAGTAADEPAWRSQDGIERDVRLAAILVELSPISGFADEFQQLSKKHGDARLAVEVRHSDRAYAIVQFGNTTTNRRVYRADELRLLSVI